MELAISVTHIRCIITQDLDKSPGTVDANLLSIFDEPVSIIDPDDSSFSSKKPCLTNQKICAKKLGVLPHADLETVLFYRCTDNL